MPETVPFRKNIAIALIDPDEAQPREFFDEEELASLAQSIAARGVLNDLIVRPNKEKPGRFVLVAGERRWLAAGRAGLAEVPCKVHDEMDVREALEAQLSENIDRQDMHPLEEGEAFRRLNVEHGIPVEDLAEQWRRSASTIAQRIRLTALTAAAKQAFLDGKLTLSSAVCLARVPEPLQDKVLGEVMPRGDAPLPAKDVELHINQRYRLQLVDAPFKLTDATLFPEAGACADCPKRTTNDPNLFGEVTDADLCTDPQCFQLKADVEWERVSAVAEKAGQKVIEDAQALKFIRYGRVDAAAPYVSLDDVVPHDAKRRTWRQLLPPTVKVTLARANNKVFHLVSRKELPEPEAVATGSKNGSPAPSAKTAKQDKMAADIRAEAKIGRKARQLAIAEIVAMQSKRRDWRPLMRIAAKALIGSTGETVRAAVCKRRDLTVGDGYDATAAVLRKLVDKGDDADVCGMVSELAIGGPNNDSDALDALLDACGLKMREFEKQAKAEKGGDE